MWLQKNDIISFLSKNCPIYNKFDRDMGTSINYYIGVEQSEVPVVFNHYLIC